MRRPYDGVVPESTGGCVAEHLKPRRLCPHHDKKKTIDVQEHFTVRVSLRRLAGFPLKTPLPPPELRGSHSVSPGVFEHDAMHEAPVTESF